MSFNNREALTLNFWWLRKIKFGKIIKFALGNAVKVGHTANKSRRIGI